MKESEKIARIIRFNRIECYYNSEIQPKSPGQWIGLQSYLRAHEILTQMIDYCEGYIEAGRNELGSLLQKVDRGSLIQSYTNAVSITISVLKKNDGSTILTVIFWDTLGRVDGPSTWFTFTIEMWGHISRVSQNDTDHTSHKQLVEAKEAGILP